MEYDVLVGSTSGVFHLNGGRSAEFRGLEGQRVSAIYAWRTDGDLTILAGTYGDGMYRSTDSGKTWEPANDGLTAPALRTIQPDPSGNGAIICGCEPGRGFRSSDGGKSWAEMDDITRLQGVDTWYLPYSPRAGALRNFYSPPGQPERLLGAVEVGGLLDSVDNGTTWRLVDIQPDDDVHFVTGHPTDGNLLYAALGWASLTKNRGHLDEPQLGGLARSRDSGATWEKLFTDYIRAVIVPDARPDLLLAAPAPRVGQQGRISVSPDQGDTWQDASGGIETPMPDMVEVFVPAPDGSIWAVCSGGRLLRAEPGVWTWTSMLDGSIEADSVTFVGR